MRASLRPSMAVVLGVAVVLAFAASGAQGAEVVKVGELPVISNAGFYIAAEKGYFAEKGLTVETERFASGAKMVAPLATGQLDVAMGSPSAGLYNAIASGMDFKIVADKGQLHVGHSFTPLVVRKDLVDGGRVKSLRDLKGMKVAGGAKGINLDYFLAKMLEHEGLSYRDVEMTYLPYPDIVTALGSKAVDAAIVPEPWGVRVEERKVAIRFYLSERVPAITNFQVAVIMYAGKFITARPQAAREFLRAYVRGVRYYTERGLKDGEVARIISKYTKLPEETIAATIPFYIDPNARPRVDDLATFQDWFHQMGWVKAKVPIERVVDLQFLE